MYDLAAHVYPYMSMRTYIHTYIHSYIYSVNKHILMQTSQPTNIHNVDIHVCMFFLKTIRISTVVVMMITMVIMMKTRPLLARLRIANIMIPSKHDHLSFCTRKPCER